MQNEKSSYFSPSNEARLKELETRTKALTPPMIIELEGLIERRRKTREVKLSDSCKNYLRSLYLSQRYGNRYSFLGGVGIQQMVRGIKQEDWAVKMLSEFRNKEYFRDKKRLRDTHLIGSVDVLDSKSILTASRIVEIKTKETIGEFNKRIGVPLEDSHFLQMQGYINLANKEIGEVVYCLVPPSEDKIQEQKELFYELKNNNKKWESVESNIRFLDIPLNEKIISYKVERDKNVIDEIYQRVEVCRNWIVDFEKYHIDWLNDNK
jgi:hypothetical protein